MWLKRPKSIPREEAARFVTALYRGILRREPDPEGAAHYIAAVISGRTPASIAEEFIGSRESQLAASPKLFVPPGHYYSPIVDPIEAARQLQSRQSQPLPDNVSGISIDRQEMIRTWKRLLPYMQSVPFVEREGSQFRYQFDNPSFSWGDGITLHAMLRRHAPKRLIEIGSGWSSACTLDTVEHYLGNNCELTFIEPYPELLRRVLGASAETVRIMEMPVQQVSETIFATLEANDVLFIDSTHVLRTGSDVCFELFNILPRLGSGVLVHFHDMFWPFEYPYEWIVEENRSWNELYAIRAFLTDNDGWRIVFFNDYLAKLEPEMIHATCPSFMRNSGGSLWLQRR